MLTVELVKLPKPLRKGIDRRLPRYATFKDLPCRKFGNRVVLGFAGFKGAHAAWLCRCKCGRQSVVAGAYLRNGTAGSCGCIGRLSPAAKALQPLLESLKSRCHNRNNPAYPWYGGRRTSVCKRWRESAEAFARDMGPRPSLKHFIARRNQRGNYTPTNCYWGTRGEILNRRDRTITYNAKTQNVAQWADELGISRERMRQRVNRCLELGLHSSCAITYRGKAGRPRKAQIEK